MKPLIIRKYRPEDTGALVEVWAEAAAATHHFLTKEEFRYYRQQIPQYLQAVEVYVAERADDTGNNKSLETGENTGGVADISKKGMPETLGITMTP